MSDTFLPGSGFDTYESQDKVLVQMDGSRECAVAVRILQQQGFAVAGAAVRLAAEQTADAESAKKAAEALGIECIVLKAEALADQPAEVLGAPRKGLRFVFSGDSAPCPALEQAAQGADLLLCDATYALPEQQEQAAQWGIIWQLVDDSELADTSLQLARHLAAQPTFGLGLIKKALLASETNSLDAQLDLERDYQRLAGRSDDYREGVSAFLAKRPPQFSGK